MDHLFDVRGEQGPEPVVVALQLTGKQQGSPVLFLRLRPLHTDHIQGGQGQHVHLIKPTPEGEQLLQPLPGLHRLAGRVHLGGRLLLDGSPPLGGR